MPSCRRTERIPRQQAEQPKDRQPCQGYGQRSRQLKPDRQISADHKDKMAHQDSDKDTASNDDEEAQQQLHYDHSG
jgi:hypothetical protein